MTNPPLLALFEDGTALVVLAVSAGIGWVLPDDPGPLIDPGTLAGFRGYSVTAPRPGTAGEAALAYLTEHGRATNAELAEHARVAPPTMYRALETLRKRSAVTRHGYQYRLARAPLSEGAEYVLGIMEQVPEAPWGRWEFADDPKFRGDPEATYQELLRAGRVKPDGAGWRLA